MPQMAPMSWTMLMIMFLMMMIIINNIMYFSKNYKLSSKIFKKKNVNNNWKW